MKIGLVLLILLISLSAQQCESFSLPSPKFAGLNIKPFAISKQQQQQQQQQQFVLTRKLSSLHVSTASASEIQPEVPSTLERFRKASAMICNFFPVWTLITAGSALYRPALFESIDPKSFTGLIGALMLCMGITLKPEDFKRVVQRPVAVLLAFVGCYVIMPCLALILSKVFNLGPSLSAGLVLVSCINGAQASNLCTYIGQGDLALSVLMTTMTTIGAIVMTPTVGKLLLGKVVPVDSVAIAKSTVQVVLAPIILGMVS